MQHSDRYRQFADTLAAAAREANGPAHDVLLQTAAAWRALAETPEPPASDAGRVVDFAEAARRLRPTSRA